jgi:hypothetical protein
MRPSRGGGASERCFLSLRVVQIVCSVLHRLRSIVLRYQLAQVGTVVVCSPQITSDLAIMLIVFNNMSTSMLTILSIICVAIFVRIEEQEPPDSESDAIVNRRRVSLGFPELIQE